MTAATGTVTVTPEAEARLRALQLVARVLTVKAGKYAERPLNPAHLIELAEYVLSGPDASIEAWLTFGEDPEFDQDFADRVDAARERAVAKFRDLDGRATE